MTKTQDSPKVPDVGDQITVNFGSTTEDYTVQPSCGSDSAGRWYCVTHEHIPAHNWGLWSHYGNDATKHTIVWFCFEHGPEQP